MPLTETGDINFIEQSIFSACVAAMFKQRTAYGLSVEAPDEADDLAMQVAMTFAGRAVVAYRRVIETNRRQWEESRRAHTD